MKITLYVEKELIDEAKTEIEGYYCEALEKAKEKAENDMDIIAKKIVSKVKESLKLLKIEEVNKHGRRTKTSRSCCRSKSRRNAS